MKSSFQFSKAWDVKDLGLVYFEAIFYGKPSPHTWGFNTMDNRVRGLGLVHLEASVHGKYTFEVYVSYTLSAQFMETRFMPHTPLGFSPWKVCFKVYVQYTFQGSVQQSEAYWLSPWKQRFEFYAPYTFRFQYFESMLQGLRPVHLQGSVNGKSHRGLLVKSM